METNGDGRGGREFRRANDPPPKDDASTRVRRAVDGDPEALEWVADWLTALMESWVRSRLPSARRDDAIASDVVQDVWLSLLPALPKVRPHPGRGHRMTPAIMGLARTAVRNRVIDHQRQDLRNRIQGGGETLPEAHAPTPGPLTALLRSEFRREVDRALDSVSPRDRDLYVSRLFEETTMQELAERNDMSIPAIVKARQRVRSRLVQVLGPYVLDDLEPDASASVDANDH